MNNAIKYPLVLLCVCAAAGLALAATFALTFDTIKQKAKQKEVQAIITSFWNVEPPPGAKWDKYSELKGAGVYEAHFDLRGRKVTAYAAQGAASGYSSIIKLMAGAEPLGEGKYRILGVKVISQQETPGLGARVNDIPPGGTVWTALAAMFADSEEEEPVETPELLAAAKALSMPAKTFPARPRFQEQFAGKIIVVKEGKASGIETGWDWKKLQEGEYPPGEHEVAAMTGATISSKAVIAAVYDAVKNIDKALATGTGKSDN